MVQIVEYLGQFDSPPVNKPLFDLLLLRKHLLQRVPFNIPLYKEGALLGLKDIYYLRQTDVVQAFEHICLISKRCVFSIHKFYDPLAPQLPVPCQEGPAHPSAVDLPYELVFLLEGRDVEHRAVIAQVDLRDFPLFVLRDHCHSACLAVQMRFGSPMGWHSVSLSHCRNNIAPFRLLVEKSAVLPLPSPGKKQENGKPRSYNKEASSRCKKNMINIHRSISCPADRSSRLSYRCGRPARRPQINIYVSCPNYLPFATLSIRCTRAASCARVVNPWGSIDMPPTPLKMLCL